MVSYFRCAVAGLIGTMLFLPLAGWCGADGGTVQTSLTPTRVIETTLAALGLPEEGLEVSATPVTLPDRALPTVDTGENREAWLVHIKGVRLEATDGSQTRRNPYIQSLDMVVSSATGQVISVRSPAPVGESEVWPFPPVKAYEERMAKSEETFAGLPASAPRVTLMQALTKAEGGFQNARQIVAYYVIYRRTHGEPRELPVWVVHLWGIPPFEPIGGPPESVHLQARNHLRSFVDAETGRSLGSDNSPAPSASLEMLRQKYQGRIVTGITDDWQKSAEAMEELLAEWDPVGHTAESVRYVLGPPREPLKQDVLAYFFRSGRAGVQWEFDLRDGVVVWVRKVEGE